MIEKEFFEVQERIIGVTRWVASLNLDLDDFKRTIGRYADNDPLSTRVFPFDPRPYDFPKLTKAFKVFYDEAKRQTYPPLPKTGADHG